MRKLCLWITLFVGLSAAAQSSTRPVSLTWPASSSSGITGYNVFRCTVVSPATTCTPSMTATPLGTATTANYLDSAATGASYVYAVTAVSPACTSSSATTSVCGQSAPSTSAPVPVPPQPASGGQIIVVVP